ncbi:hypothetical protein IWQ62_003539 [Dispira parvispora]|uniref:Uncharacterized protein n=1 Tax=Dispira parvispora TaxID=1520584 RepID=A0A9W8E6F9_9FUNG|nr:hypothetical protein IWQ62_003539 [Dispira parvispora]
MPSPQSISTIQKLAAESLVTQCNPIDLWQQFQANPPAWTPQDRYGLFRALLAEERLAESLDCWTLQVRLGYSLDGHAGLQLLERCAQVGNHQAVLQIFDIFAINQVIPPTNSLIRIFEAYYHLGNVETAARLFATLDSTNQLLPSTLYQIMAKCYAKQGRFTETRQMTKRASRQRVPIDDQGWLDLLDIFAHRKMIYAVQWVERRIHRARSRNRSPRATEVYTRLIHIYGGLEARQELTALWDQLVRAGFTWDESTLCALCQACAKLSHEDILGQLTQSSDLSGDSFTSSEYYTALLSACCQVGSPALAYRALVHVMTSGWVEMPASTLQQSYRLFRSKKHRDYLNQLHAFVKSKDRDWQERWWSIVQ